MITRGCVSYLHIHATLKGFLPRTSCSYVIDFFVVNVWHVHHILKKLQIKKIENA